MNKSESRLPNRFVDLKREIAASHPDFQQQLTRAWIEVLRELEERAHHIVQGGSSVSSFLLWLSSFWGVFHGQYIPQINFKDLATLKPEQINDIKRKGSVVIKDVVDDIEALSWKTSLKEFVTANPNVEGRSASL